ncbi:MAG: hypothetical protein JWO86_8555 [Myxococcaceae bacterium]|nr:hypothetical protein [Myxococcaceae bacterium]
MRANFRKTHLLVIAIGVGVAVPGCMMKPNNGTTDSRPDIVNFSSDQNGYTTQSGGTVLLQMLSPTTADPSDPNNWKTYKSATAGSTKKYFFAGDTPPNADNPLYAWSTPVLTPTQGDSTRFPQGGLGRIRATAADGTHVFRIFDNDWLQCTLPVNTYSEFATKCGSYNDFAVLVSAAPTPAENLAPPGGRWLADSSAADPVLDQANTLKYYDHIGAGPSGPIGTLKGFKSTFGFATAGGQETNAVYYNNGDLGLGRNMTCRTNGKSQIACYVTNYADRKSDDVNVPIFGGTDAQKQDALAQAIGNKNPIATVAMVYDSAVAGDNPIKFVVYDAAGKPQPFAALDNHAANKQNGSSVAVPTNCMACHGGSGYYDRDNLKTVNAHFLLFDPQSFVYSPAKGFSRSEQEPKFKQLNTFVYNAGSTAATREALQAMYGSASGPAGGTVVTDNAVVTGYTDSWASQQLYTQVVAPYCRTCHTSREDYDSSAFRTIDTFTNHQAGILERTCLTQDMPHAEQAQRTFWASSARAHLVAWSGSTADCVPDLKAY